MSEQDTTAETIKKIPYGISDYEKIRLDNCYYVDKTMYLRSIEEAGDYIFFIRPRRFGKSLFLSVLGFTKEDAVEMIDYYKQKGIIKYDREFLLNIMNTWYNNYIFSKKSTTTLFNSDMILYFLDECIRNHDIPDELIDQNVRIDYGKLRHLIIIDKDKGRVTNGNFTRLQQIIEKGEMVSDIAKGFPVEKLIDTRNFLSLLFYLGLLTVKEMKDEELILQIPSETARRLYYNYIKEAYEEKS